MDGLDNRKISWPIAGNPPEHTERVGKGTFLRASFLRRAERKIRGTESRPVGERTETEKKEKTTRRKHGERDRDREKERERGREKGLQ